MPSESQPRERRRGERVLIRVPVQVRGEGEGGLKVAEAAEAVVVSRFGALLRVSTRLKKGSALTVTNAYSQAAEQFRVVWVAEVPTDGRWDVGVEALQPLEEFWGIRFPPSSLQA